MFCQIYLLKYLFWFRGFVATYLDQSNISNKDHDMRLGVPNS